ncbi:hypothetical protein E6H17_06270 [Candidatus Bathyarchaeota archaeon]|nr:MAG: hypothetical protein E6H17_06270 [Candidatus Bathyarchaeota archaeon]
MTRSTMLTGQTRKATLAGYCIGSINIKAHLLKGHVEDSDESFVSKLVANGIFPVYVEEAWKNHEAAREALNDMLSTSKKRLIPNEVAVDPDVLRLKRHLEDCLSFEKFRPDEKNSRDLRDMRIEGQFFARALTINYRRILFDIVGMNSPSKRRHQTRR